jgi:hypothetical protein
MGVGADHEAGAAVAEKAHRLLLAGRLAMHVDDDGVGASRLSGQASSSRSTAANGSSSGSMKMRPMALMTSTRAPFLASISAAPRPGVPGG